MTRPGHPGGPPAECLISGCHLPTRARGMCAMHYARWHRHGDPTVCLPLGGRRRPVGELFWSKVDYQGPVPHNAPELGACWQWTGAASRVGFGAFNVAADASGTGRRRSVPAHVWAFQDRYGPLPDGHTLAHACHLADAEHCPGGTACGHRLCVRSSHLLEVTTDSTRGRPQTAAATRAGQLHCPRGHRYDLVGADGRRRCSQCVQNQAAQHTPTTTAPIRKHQP